MSCETCEGSESVEDNCDLNALYLAVLTLIMGEWSSAVDAEAYDDL